ncbi:secondary thiamine-phosphate synthase enzyme YjbQ [Candidatus Endomicrobiellum agilis]|jgi:secondary thiamine-phosphate synthase enzyme|uniref:secondary thiamine-phosphate synthase enzyme YjbQ n=1 Tax=Candidatus Endomicrobiellum agilis TaxID=3238957 RepID=UPI00357E4451|nr:secondary thiamine-phosphate synthase enzyme YjbQ [Endomicrobium sp.]
MIYSEYINCETKGYTDILDITDDIKRVVARSGITNGIATLGVTSSTSAITTLEFEPGLVEDFRKSLEVIAPVKGVYAHDEKWHDGNGFSHIRSSLIGTSKTIPIVSKSLMTGTWQQIILVDFDNRPRSRKVFVQVFGE